MYQLGAIRPNKFINHRQQAGWAAKSATSQQGGGKLKELYFIMNRATIIAIGLMLSFAAEATEYLPNFGVTSKWLQANKKAIAGIFELLEKEPSGTYIRLLGEDFTFKRMEGEEVVKFTPRNIHEYKSLALNISNVFFTIRDGNYFVESGTMSFCGKTQCLQQLVQYRKKADSISCTSDNISKPSSSCTFPIITDWHVLYIKLDIDRNYEKIGQEKMNE